MSVPQFSNFKIKTQLIIGFSIVLFVFGLAGIYSISKIKLITTQDQFLYNQMFVVSASVQDVKSGVYNLKSALKDALLAQNKNQLETAKSKLEIRDKQVNDAFEKIYKNYSGKTLDIDEALKEYKNWSLIREQTIELIEAGKLKEATDLTREIGTEQVLVIIDKTSVIEEFTSKVAYELHTKSRKNGKEVTIITILVFFFLFVLGISISLFVSNSVSKPITQFVNKIAPMINRVFNENTFSEKQLLSNLGNELYSSYEQLKTNYSFQKDSLKSKLESEELFLELVANTHSGIFILDVSKFIYVNKALCDITGYSYDELIDLEYFFNLISNQEDKYCLGLEMEEILGSKIKSSVIEIQIKDKNNQIIELEVSLRKIVLGSKKLVLASIEDISKLKRAKNALIENEEKLTKAINSFSDGIYITSPNYTIEYLNSAMSKLIGNDKIGKNCYRAIHNLDSKCEWCVYEKLKLGKTLSYDYYSNSKGKYFEIRNTLLENKSKMTVYHDVTEEKQAKKKLLHAVISTEEKERKRFAEDLHDELGPHLSAIRLCISELSEENINSEKRKKLSETMDSLIKDSIDKISTISNQLMPNILMDFGLLKALKSFCDRINLTNKIEIHYTAKDIKEPLNSTLEIVIYRLVTELIHNTIKHANAKHIQIKLIQTKANIELTYKDDGIGFNLEEELIKKNGLGLSNILNRIKTLESNYTYKSIENEGIIFNFKFKI